jgi:aryl-alcohol dehydrogenase-like predicted oxidoreductase
MLTQGYAVCQLEYELGEYAQFLDEADTLLDKPELAAVAEQFRLSAAAWDALSEALLPDEVKRIGQTRQLLGRKHRLFLDQGDAGVEEIRTINAQLAAIKAEIATDFPLSAGDVAALQAQIAKAMQRIDEIEQAAVTQLRQTRTV